ncbi:MAG: cytochrome c-type biosis protein CcmH [Solirubrobacteraceae bacterium]|jgi:cytochrome c-type biogenesis protein CcmH|nr:cytochrome c-type biosis protein CcmH [Solirubrobacteraceae bacterium]MEA2319193.1 cytochrome c-type biosis protein CcmH [Solirubrobacteraceae bacterium]
MIARLLTLLAVLTLALAPAASAATPRASFNDLEDEVMCDVCNVPLNIAEAPRAEQQRREIKQLIAQGLTKQQIKDELVRRYGPAILASPQDHGFSLAAYLVPIAVVVALIAGLLLLLPRWRRRRPAPGPDDPDAAGPALSAADARRLDDELARFGA